MESTTSELLVFLGEPAGSERIHSADDGHLHERPRGHSRDGRSSLSVGYSQFCYELPFMPGQTGYFDTPVIPTAAFAADTTIRLRYPDATPAIGEVDGSGVGPWVSAAGQSLTIYTINGKNTPAGVIAGDQVVNNYGYSGPSQTTAPWNQKTINRTMALAASRGTGSVTIGGVTATSPAGTTPQSLSLCLAAYRCARSSSAVAMALSLTAVPVAVNWSSRPVTARHRSTP